MNFSSHNILSKIKGRNDSFVVNLLSGNADIIEENKIDIFSDKGDITPEMIAKGYVITKEAEQLLFDEKYAEFIQNRNEDEVQLFFVPGYSCNFSCSYCYQNGYDNEATPLRKDLIDGFFRYVAQNFADKKKYVTLFGGEPLLPGFAYLQSIDYFLIQAKQRNIDVAVVTNGYNLVEYLPILKKTRIREIQVTLDGTQEVHDKRRTLKNGNGSFEKIVNAIDKSLTMGFSINLRTVIDKDNIDNFAALARFAIEKGWTKNPLFKTQIGRNYELHQCSSNSSKLYTRLSLYEDFYSEITKHPEILDFFKPAFSVANYLHEHGELPEPLFDACPACKTEWAFDYTGKIYSCTATVGKQDEALGTFFPEVFLDTEKVNQWQCRDITTIPECEGCNLQLACGGGCGSVAKNKNGKATSPDCRPVKELLEMGIALYFAEK
jgi:uncharacterized protein